MALERAGQGGEGSVPPAPCSEHTSLEGRAQHKAPALPRQFKHVYLYMCIYICVYIYLCVYIYMYIYINIYCLKISWLSPYNCTFSEKSIFFFFSLCMSRFFSRPLRAEQ